MQVPEPPRFNSDTYELPEHNYSIEQIRYQQRMKNASIRQNLVYRNNLNAQQFFSSEKEKYAK